MGQPELESGPAPAPCRFPFGENWRSFLSVLDEDRVRLAQQSLTDMLELDDLQGLSFLDIGSGSGLFSLAARRLGARVLSFDRDLDSVRCTEELRRRERTPEEFWRVVRGSVLDRRFVEGLGSFDITYAWGVLHHTGSLYQAIYNAQLAVSRRGRLFLGIYNDQGTVSSFWRVIKRTYCGGRAGRIAMTGLFYPGFFLGGLLPDLLRLRDPSRRYREHRRLRGMSLVHDWKDWLGGHPYEPATPARVRDFVENLGYELLRLEETKHGFGNNQFVFRRAGLP